jgi:hypothetical protein
MIRAASLVAIALLAAACQPQKTPEQIQREQAAAALGQMAAAFGANGQPGQVDPKAMAQAMAQAGAIAAMDPNLSAEERAKMQAVTGAIASGNVHPAASAYVAGLDKVFTVISTIKDDASAAAAKPQLAAIYATMAAPAAQLKAMNQDERDVAFGSAYGQLAGFAMKMAGVMMPLASKPELASKVDDLLDEMPQPE